MKLNFNIFLSLTILIAGFIGQIFIVNVLGLSYLGHYAMIRLLNSEGFVAFYDLGLSEEVLYQRSINKVWFYLRLGISTSIIWLLSSFRESFFSLPIHDWNYLFILLLSNYILYLCRLNIRINNLVHVLRVQDLLISIIAPLVFLLSENLSILVLALIIINCLMIIWSGFFLLSRDKIVLDNRKISFRESMNFYFSTLVAKAEGSIITLLIPTLVGSYAAVGLYDLCFKIPKAFKSQLGELNALLKVDYLTTGTRNVHLRNSKVLSLLILLSICALTADYIYLSLLNQQVTNTMWLLVCSELAIGLFFVYNNIELVQLYKIHRLRLEYSLTSMIRIILFAIVALLFVNSMTLESLLFIWYILFASFIIRIYTLLKIHRKK